MHLFYSLVIFRHTACYAHTKHTNTIPNHQGFSNHSNKYGKEVVSCVVNFSPGPISRPCIYNNYCSTEQSKNGIFRGPLGLGHRDDCEFSSQILWLACEDISCAYSCSLLCMQKQQIIMWPTFIGSKYTTIRHGKCC